MGNLTLPPTEPSPTPVQWNNVQSVVIVGANGSGKSRMGAWIEQNSELTVHRVGAQRALTIPPVITPQPYEQAIARHQFGDWSADWNRDTYRQIKISRRWNGDWTGSLLNDFEALLTTLFADAAKRDRAYTRAARNAVPTEVAPHANIDKLEEIWNRILPHRSLIFGDDKIQAKAKNDVAYEGRHMSDGERVIVYLIGQVLCAQPDTVLVIDEPEIHVHEAIQSTLWDNLEKARPDCVFVYITHDLRFAASRVTARKIWVKAYDGTNWEWDEIPSETGLPEPLLLEILGSRRPVLFVEGERTSYDYGLYSALYPDYLVIPLQSSSKVREATQALANLDMLHHLNARGFVDRDRKNDQEVEALLKSGVSVIGVAEVENLLCLPSVIKAVAEQLMKEDSEALCNQAQEKIISNFNDNIAQQALMRALAEIQFRLRGFGPELQNKLPTELQTELQDYVSTLNFTTEVTNTRNLMQRLIDERDYRGVLRYYNCKSIPASVARILELKKAEYCRLALEIIKKYPDGPIANEIRNVING